MAGLIGNLVYRVSVSAIVGAVVAGGVIYLNNDRVVKSYKAQMAEHIELQDMTNKVLMESSDAMASAIGVMEAEQNAQLVELGKIITGLTAEIATLQTGTPETVAPLEPTNNTPISDNALGDIIKIVPAPTTTPEE